MKDEDAYFGPKLIRHIDKSILRTFSKNESGKYLIKTIRKGSKKVSE